MSSPARVELSVAEVMPILRKHANRPFGDFLEPEVMERVEADRGRNKGGLGNLLETVLGLPASTRLNDLTDGELKTHKSSSVGSPLETVAVTMLNTCIDDLLDDVPFRMSRPGRKMSRSIFVPVYRDPSVVAYDWRYLDPVFVDLGAQEWHGVADQLSHDFSEISREVREGLLTGDTMLHGTTSRGRLLQIRTKDSKPYHPIYSKKAQRVISNKNYAFYLTKSFITTIHQVSGYRYGP